MVATTVFFSESMTEIDGHVVPWPFPEFTTYTSLRLGLAVTPVGFCPT